MLLLAVMFSWVIYMSLHMFDMNINHRIMVEGDYTDLNDRINTLEGKVRESTSKVSELTARLNELETQ
jgi:predicted RNase H-like nuclease (RuvC/YqgF family)